MRLEPQQLLAAEALHGCLAASGCIKQRIFDLLNDRSTSSRDLLIFTKMPRIGVRDVEKHDCLLRGLIDFDRNNREMIRSALVAEHSVRLLDAAHHHLLSGSDIVLLRDEYAPATLIKLHNSNKKKQVSYSVRNGMYCRWEGDKLRLLWAFFKRLCGRADFSPNLKVWRLKQYYFTLNAADGAGRASDDAIVQCVVRDQSKPSTLLDALQQFPSDDDACDVVSVSSSDEDCLAIVPSPVHVPMLAAPEAEAVVATPISEAVDLCSEDVVDPECPPLPHDFLHAPLPESHPVGLKRKLPLNGPQDLDAILASLKAPLQYDSKAHARNVKGKEAMKRPAGAKLSMPSVPATEPTIDEGMPPTLADAATSEASQDEIDESIAKCIAKACTDKTCQDVRPAKLVVTVKRGTYIVILSSGKRQQTMVTEKQFGSRPRALAAGRILLGLWNSGASKEDLQRCKNLGCIFDTYCGAKC